MRIKLNLRSKLLLAVLAIVFVAYALSTTQQIRKVKELNRKFANEVALSAGKESRTAVFNFINTEIDKSDSLANRAKKHLSASGREALDGIKRTLEERATNNPHYTSVWASIELGAVDPSYTKGHGRVRLTYYRDNGTLVYKQDTLDLAKENTNGTYYQSKATKRSIVTDPYWFSYNKKDSVLETSVGSPIIIGGKFCGLTGYDLSLDYFQKIVSKIQVMNGAQTFLLSQNGSIIAGSDSTLRGTNIDVIFDSAQAAELLESQKNGENGSIEIKASKDSKHLFTVLPIQFNDAKTNWGFGYLIPMNHLLGSEKDALRSIWQLAIITLIVVVLLVLFISYQISHPLVKVNKALEELSRGKINESSKVFVKTNDELMDISNSTNALIDSLLKTVNFAKEVGKGNLAVEFEPQSKEDTLGIALLDMKKNLEDAQKMEALRKIEDEKINWATKGVALFGELLRHNETNLEEFSYHILSNLIDYVKADVGGLFLVNDSEEKGRTIDLMACYAYDRRKYEERSLIVGEGLVGRCVQESETIFLTEIPSGYITIGSGLGENDPTCILIVPLKLNDEVYGVIELATFEPFEQYIVDFVEKIGVTIASTISTARVNIKTKQLLEASKFQADELSAQEEEMRQNMEELIATQEESARKSKEIENLISSLHSSSNIIEYDIEGFVISANDSILSLLGMRRENLLGLNVKEIDTYVAATFEEFWNNLRRGISYKVKSVVKGLSGDLTMYETFIPITDEDDKVVKIMVIAYSLEDFDVSIYDRIAQKGKQSSKA